MCCLPHGCQTGSREKEVVVNKPVALPQLTVFWGGEWRGLKVLKTRILYDLFLLKEVKKPGSLKFWERVMPGLTAERVWRGWRITQNSLESEDNDFKLRHNRIFTNSVLHQIDRTINKKCDVCKQENEDLLHLFINCDELKKCCEKLKQLLRRCLSFEENNVENWNELLLFGVYDKKCVKNYKLCNFLLSHWRWAVRLKRNIAHYEKRVVKVWPIFKNVVTKSVRFRWIYGTRNFHNVFVKNNTLISVDEQHKIVWSW